MNTIKLENIIDLKKWHKIQDLFASVIGVSIYTLDREGDLIISPSKITRLCVELRQNAFSCPETCIDCVGHAVNSFLEKQKNHVSCVAGLDNFIVPIMVEELHVVGFLVVGPVLLGGRRKDDVYRAVCEEIGIDFEIYIDALREVKVFSHASMHSVISLLSDTINYIVKLGYQKKKVELWFPGFLNSNENSQNAYTKLYLNKLLNSSLDIAMSVTKADSGSVMIYDRKHSELSVRLSQGSSLNVCDFPPVKLGEKISGYVASERKGLLLSGQVQSLAIKRRLKRPEIRASFVIPIKMEDVLYGVFSVNAFSDNELFNNKNLLLLSQLGELAAAAISNFKVENVEAQEKQELS